MKIHAPNFLLQLILGEMAIEVLKSTNVSSEKIQQEGFTFLFDEIDTCIDNLMH
jgi:NAD dependent epimerase/dehydratase family enzyme